MAGPGRDASPAKGLAKVMKAADAMAAAGPANAGVCLVASLPIFHQTQNRG